MKLYRHAGNIKSGLFIMGIALVIGLLAYTQILVNQLRRDNRSIVRLYAGLIANVVEDENDTNLDYIFENIIQKVKFPLIQTDTDHNPQMWKIGSPYRRRNDPQPPIIPLHRRKPYLQTPMDGYLEPFPSSDELVGKSFFCIVRTVRLYRSYQFPESMQSSQRLVYMR